MKKIGREWYFTTVELAMMTGLSRQAIFKKVKSGEIKSSPLSKKGILLIGRREAEKFLSKFPTIDHPFKKETH